MSCARSRKTTSSATSAAESGAPLECASSSRECRYLTDRYGSRKAALTIRARTSGSQAFKAVARAGVVDQTSEDTVGESGRNAIGPVGRKRW
jgi:SLT domain-containing protein